MKPIYSCKTCKLCKKKIQVNHGIFIHFAADCLFDLKGNLHIWKNHRERIVEKKKSVFRLLRTMFLYALLQAVDIITGILWIALTIVIAPFAILSDLLR